MTMPKSPIMVEAVSKSPEQERSKSLVSTLARDVKLEREQEQPSPLERTIVQTGVDFDRCEEASAREEEVP